MIAPPLDVEVVVLGRGVGESVLVRVADEWVVIDSFQTRRNDRSEDYPAPLVYLQDRGIEAVTAVREVVLTHLHADHCRGIDEVVRVCEAANFHLPAAIPEDKWRTIVSMSVDDQDRRALASVATAYRYANDDGRFRTAGATTIVSRGSDVVRAIGPAQRAMQAARDALAAEDLEAARRVVNENYTSIVVIVMTSAACALLGADMDAHNALGWPQLITEFAQTAWIRPAGLVKVPHHGSRTAFHVGMYERWTDSPLGILTPNGSRLPTDDMIGTLKQHVRELYLAGPAYGEALKEHDAHAPSKMYAVRATHDGVAGSNWVIEPDPEPYQIL